METESRYHRNLVEIVRQNVAADKNAGFKKAIEECVKNGILKESLGRKTREVMNMLKEGYKINSLSKCTGLPLAVIRKLKEEQ